MIRAWGGTPVPVELSEGIRLITSAAVDAQENPLANTIAYGVDRVHQHVTMTAHLYGARGLYAHPATLEALPDDVATALRQAARSAIEWQRRAAAAKETEIRTDLESRGTQFVDLSADEAAEFHNATATVIREAAETVGPALVDMARNP